MTEGNALFYNIEYEDNKFTVTINDEGTAEEAIYTTLTNYIKTFIAQEDFLHAILELMDSGDDEERRNGICMGLFFIDNYITEPRLLADYENFELMLGEVNK